MKKMIALLLAALMVFALAACAANQTPADAQTEAPTQQTEAPAQSETEAEPASDEKEPVTLTMMIQANNANLTYYQRMIAAYEEQTGNKIDVLGIDNDNFDTVATSKFATGDIPDIFVHHNNSALANYDPSNNFYTLNDQSWVGELTDEAYKNALDDNGNLLGLPFGENSISGFYYNKTILAELDLEPAATQEEFDALCQAIYDAGYTPLCFPIQNCMWMYQFAMDPVFADHPELLEKINKNEIKYSDIPEIAAMCQWVKDAADKGWFGDTYMSDGWDDLSPIMGTGEAVIIPIWDTWFITDFDDSNDYTMDDFGVMPVFMNTVENGTYEGGNVLMIMANKNSDKLDDVLEFMSFCASPEVYNAAFEGVPTVSIYKNQTTNIQTPMVVEAADSLSACLRDSTTSSKVIGYTQADTATAVQELVLGTVDVDGCVALMDESRIATAKAFGTEGF